MKILLIGEVTGNTGPSNVHKSLVEYWPSCDSIRPLYSKSKISKLYEAISEGLKSDVIVSCGAGWTDIIAHRVLSAFGKPVIALIMGTSLLRMRSTVSDIAIELSRQSLSICVLRI